MTSTLRFNDLPKNRKEKPKRLFFTRAMFGLSVAVGLAIGLPITASSFLEDAKVANSKAQAAEVFTFNKFDKLELSFSKPFEITLSKGSTIGNTFIHLVYAGHAAPAKIVDVKEKGFTAEFDEDGVSKVFIAYGSTARLNVSFAQDGDYVKLPVTFSNGGSANSVKLTYFCQGKVQGEVDGQSDSTKYPFCPKTKQI